MRFFAATGLIAALALAGPALTGLATSGWAAEPAAPLHAATTALDVVRAERFQVEGIGGRESRAAIRWLRQAEGALSKFVSAWETDPELDARKLRWAAKSGRAVERAIATGRLSGDATVGADWSAFLDVLMADVDRGVEEAGTERDRLIVDAFRDKVTRSLDKGLTLLRSADGEVTPARRVAAVARAFVHVERARVKALKFCAKETKPDCPGGALAQNTRLSYRAGGGLTVYDLSWDVALHAKNGTFYARRVGHLDVPGALLPEPLPWTLRRGESVDLLDFAAIERGFRIDGVITWRTSVGEIRVPVHVTP